MLQFYCKKLENNLTLFVIKTKKLSSLDITLYIKTGSAYEDKNNNGISHLLEHLLFLKTKQSKLSPTALDIYPYTKKDFTYFEITTHKDLIKNGLSSLFSVVASPDFTKENLEIVKKITKEELVEFYEDPYDVLSQEVDSYLYKNNSLGLSIGGSGKSIDNISTSDLKNWYIEQYNPSNMILTLVGDINISETVKKINEILKSNELPEDKKNNRKNNTITYPTTTSKPVYFKNTNFQNTHLAFVFPVGGVDSKDYFKFILLTEILNKKIRQDFENSGLFYDIDLYYHQYLNTGEIRIITACSKKNKDKVLKEINSFVENIKISNSLFEKIKNHTEYEFLLKEDNVDELSSLSLYLLKSKPKLIRLEDEINKLKKVKFSEIKETKKKYFNKKNSYYFVMN
jgi:predicted Zn-dependent peptidase